MTRKYSLKENYIKWCKSKQNRNLVGYTERHHILPKTLGGTNDASNLVTLTPQEHFCLHEILPWVFTEMGETGLAKKARKAYIGLCNRARGEVDGDSYANAEKYAEFRLKRWENQLGQFKKDYLSTHPNATMEELEKARIVAYSAAYHAEHREREKAYRSAYTAAHREERKAYRSAYNAAHREEQKAYRTEHREDIKAKKAAYNAEHRDAIKAKKAAYYAEHRDAIKAKKAAYYAEHRDKINSRQRAYVKANRAEITAKNSIRRSLKALARYFVCLVPILAYEPSDM